MKFLVFGLGNIGAEYTNTRHNIGFKVADALAKASATSFSTDRYGDRAEVKHKGKTFIVIKPSTFMNLSGKAVNYWMQKEKVPIDRVLIVTDDIALPFGTLRMKGKGSDGGHNGLKNIILILGHQNFARLRFGIGGDFPRGHQIDYVLGEWSEEENERLEERINQCKEFVFAFGTIGITRAMNFYNNK